MSELPLDDVLPAPWAAGSMRAAFRDQLARLDRTFAAIAAAIAADIGPVNRALLTGDAEAAAEHRRRYATIRDRCQQLEDACFLLIARESPVGSDLREVVAIVRAIDDLERASKHTVHIIESLDRFRPADVHPEVRRTLERLADASQRIYIAGVDAWRRRDGLAINELEELDDEVDHLQEGLLAELYRGGHRVEEVAGLSLLGRYYERLADHGVSLARHLAWAVTGDRAPSQRAGSR